MAFTISEMQEMQRILQNKYKDKWEQIGPDTGKSKLLWLVAELGEVIDIVKKKGAKSIMEDTAVRSDFVEEMADVLMYFNDIMLCFGITEDELQEAYTQKFHRNMKRW